MNCGKSNKKFLKKNLLLSLVTFAIIVCFHLLIGREVVELDLENILESTETLRKTENIFFVSSSGFDSKQNEKLNIRQACSIESAALMNPMVHISVIFVTNSSLDYSSSVRTLKKYKNIYFYRLDIVEFSSNTPAGDWISSGKLFRTKFLRENISNILRLLFLWRFGGTYLDLDVISQTSVESTGKQNFVCAQSKKLSGKDFLNNAIIGLNGQTGKKLAEILIEDFIANYNGSQWGWNGPHLITRVSNKLCKIDTAMLGQIECSGLTILQKQKCYEIHFTEWAFFFRQKLSKVALQRTKDSYFVHTWNSMTKNSTLRTTSSAAYIKIAEKYCPRTLEAAGEFF